MTVRASLVDTNAALVSGEEIDSQPGFATSDIASFFNEITTIIPSENAGRRRVQETNVEYVDFTKLLDPTYTYGDDESFFAMLSNLIQMLKTFINGSDPTGNNSLAINNLMRQMFSSDDGSPPAFRWEFSDGGFSLNLPGAGPVTLTALHLGGLDTFNMVNILNPTPGEPQTIQNEFGMDQLTVELELLETNGDNGETATTTIGLSFLDVTASIPMYLAIDENALLGFPVGALLQSEYLMPCLKDVLVDFEILELGLEIGTVERPTTGPSGTDSVLFNIIQTVFVSLPGTVPAFFDSAIRPLVNNMIQENLVETDDSGPIVLCPSQSNNGTTAINAYVDFRQFFQQGLPAFLKSFLDSQLLAIDSQTGLPKVNSLLIQPWTFNQSGIEGTLVFGDESSSLIDVATPIRIGGLEADIQLRLSDVQIENLDTITEPLSLLETVDTEPYLLKNEATIGLELGDRPLSVSMRLFMSIATADDGKIENDVEVRLDMETMNLVLAALLKIAKQRLYEFPVKDITNMNCWLATIPAPTLDSSGIRVEDAEITAALAEFSASIFRSNLNITCIECSGPRMTELSDLLSTPEAQDSVNGMMNDIMAKFAAPLLTGELVQSQVDRLLNEASRKCPHRPDYDPYSTSIEHQPMVSPDNEYDVTYLMLWGVVVLALVIIIAVLVLVIRFIVRRRHRRWIATIPKDQKDRLKLEQFRDNTMQQELNAATKSMFQSAEIPLLLRLSMPIIILGNIGLFLSGHLSLGATVNIEAQVAGETIRVDQFYEFSVARSTIDIWNAGGRALAILILIFSGIWPYTKQLMTLVIWFLPPSLLSVARRGSILLWLDWLAKWSMIDIFVLVVSIAAFRVSIQSPDVAFLPDDFYSVDLLVVPMWGLYSNMTAQLVSQVSSHFIIHYHRRIVNYGTESFKHRHQLSKAPGLHGMLAGRKTQDNSESEVNAKRTLRSHHFGRPHRGENDKLDVRSWVNYLLVILALSVMVMIIAGCSLPSLSLEILGMIGIAVESGQKFEDATTYHSVFTIVELLMDEARFLDTAGDYIGLGVLSCLFVFTVLIIPILQTVSLLGQWFMPLTMRQRTRLSITNEILQAWQYVEVYLIALFVACW